MRKAYLTSFGRRVGKSLSTTKRALMADYLSKYTTENINFGQEDKKFSLEIGFGNGEFLAELAMQNPNDIFIGCEPFLNGVGGLLTDIISKEIENIYIWPDDVRLMLSKIPENVIDEVFVLFPDPWPKQRQKKRRLINKPFLDLLRPKLKKQALIRVATDDPGYAKWILEHFSNHSMYELPEIRDWTKPYKNWQGTSYYRKALETYKRQPYFFEFYTI